MQRFNFEQSKSDSDWQKSVLILYYIMLGQYNLEQEFKSSIFKILDMKSCVGAIGGKPGKSLYFFGHDTNSSLLYFDPHFV